MNIYEFENDLDLLANLPEVGCEAVAYFPETVVGRSTTLCVDIDVSSVCIGIRQPDGVYSPVNKGLRRYHTIYAPNVDAWIPVIIPNIPFWLHAAKDNLLLSEFLQDYV